MSSLDDDMVPLGEALKETAWTRAVAKAREDLEVAMGRRQESAGPIDFIDAETLLETEYGPTPWLVDGICTEQAVMVIGGEPKTAKTWAALELAIAVATDTPFVGEFKVRGADGRGAFLFLCEDNPRSVQNRVRSMIKGRGPVLAGWGKRLAVKTLGSMRIDDIAALARYVATVRQSEIRPALVVFDPLRDLHPNNEDSSPARAGVGMAVRALRTVRGCAVRRSEVARVVGAPRRGRRRTVPDQPGAGTRGGQAEDDHVGAGGVRGQGSIGRGRLRLVPRGLRRREPRGRPGTVGLYARAGQRGEGLNEGEVEGAPDRFPAPARPRKADGPRSAAPDQGRPWCERSPVRRARGSAGRARQG